MRGRFLSKREARRVNETLQTLFGARFPENVAYYALKEKKDRYDLYLLSADASALPLEEIRDVTAGLYVAEVRGDHVRPSIEGAFLLARQGATRILHLPEALWQCWLRGRDLEDAWLEPHEDGWWIIANERGDVHGVGLKKGNVLKSFVPKQRRVQDVH